MRGLPRPALYANCAPHTAHVEWASATTNLIRSFLVRAVAVYPAPDGSFNLTQFPRSFKHLLVPVMARTAQALDLVGIPEQHRVASMGHLVVGHQLRRVSL